jgi:hypothetical protein
MNVSIAQQNLPCKISIRDHLLRKTMYDFYAPVFSQHIYASI